MDAAPLPADPLERAVRQLGYEGFRPGQRGAIETLLAVGRLLLVAPTGGGKSLSYQLPATILPGTTLVVSPLVALMADQVDALTARGVPATYLASTLPGPEIRQRMARLADGQFRLAYVAPERLVFDGFRSLLRDLQVPLLAIDEAHCISEWGHDFRPEYLQIGELVAELRNARVLACTATATPVVRDEILARLGLPADTPQLVHGFARPNLALQVREAFTARERHLAVDGQLQQALGAPGLARGTAIVYSPTRRGADEEGRRLAAAGWRTVVYHAGLEASARTRAQEAFRDGVAEVVVATNAFGMGIDRPDVRAVVHLGPPSSLEAYYQEVGRAGRDGADAFGLLLIGPTDMPLRRRLIEHGGGEGRAPSPAVVAHKWNLFLELMRWAEGGSCRHDAILRYFGDDAETLSGCGRCDCCRGLGGGSAVVDAEQTTLVVRKALSGVARVHGRFGLQAAVKLLRGENDERLERARLEHTPTFGVLREHDERWLTRLLRRCVTAGWVEFSADERPVILLTGEGRSVMRGDRPARLLLPSRESDAPPAAGAGARTRAASAAVALEGAALRVFEALRARRLRLAREEQVPPFVVASDRTLRELAATLPLNMAELQKVHGIGPAKAERYGSEWLEVVREAAAG